MGVTMMEWWAVWATVHWFLAFVIIMTGLVAFVTLTQGIIRVPFILINRFIRHLSIRKAGWPPAHVDADGDWKETSE